MVKQWRFSVLTLGFFLLFTGWSHQSVFHQTVNVQLLVQPFQANEWQVDTWMVHHGAPLDQPLTDRQLKHLTRYFRLTEQDPPFLDTPNSSQSEHVFLSDWRRNIPLEIRVIRRGHEKSVFADHYLVVNVKSVGENAGELLTTTEYVSEGLRQAGITPQMQVSIQGRAHHVLRQDEQRLLINRIMEDLDAHEVEALRDATGASVSAFSPHAGKPIESNGREMNVQIATRTDRVLHQTVITMGTPIITIEY